MAATNKVDVVNLLHFCGRYPSTSVRHPYRHCTQQSEGFSVSPLLRRKASNNSCRDGLLEFVDFELLSLLLFIAEILMEKFGWNTNFVGG